MAASAQSNNKMTAVGFLNSIFSYSLFLSLNPPSAVTLTSDPSTAFLTAAKQAFLRHLFPPQFVFCARMGIV
jgi:hypothetical protein